MCWLCHSKLTNEEVISQLKESLANPQYEVWNSTSIAHIIYSMYGANGKEAASLALQLFQGAMEFFAPGTVTDEAFILAMETRTAELDGKTDEELKADFAKFMHSDQANTMFAALNPFQNTSSLQKGVEFDKPVSQTNRDEKIIGEFENRNKDEDEKFLEEFQKSLLKGLHEIPNDKLFDGGAIEEV
jgi:hypothetical protein